MVMATGWLFKNSTYKNNLYANRGKLFCRFCQDTVSHEKKSVIDNHLASSTHKKKKKKALEKPQEDTPTQRTLTTCSKLYDGREQFVLDFVKLFAKADIPFEKIHHFQPFLQDHCKYGMCIN
ncbi:6197_t:CDS:1, partial [Racocetra persica]